MPGLLQDVQIGEKFRTKTTEMRQPLCIFSPFFFCLFSVSILSLSFSFFCFCFFYVTEGEKQGSGVDSVA
jgi:hypothetical protein